MHRPRPQKATKMDLPQKLCRILPTLPEILKLFGGQSTESYIFSKVYETFQISDNTNGIDIEANVKRSLLLVTALRERLWEIINTGHYSAVEKVHRQAYTLATACKVALIVCQTSQTLPVPSKTIEDCIYDIDYGLLLGCPLDDPHSDILNKYLTELRQFISVETTVYPGNRLQSFENTAVRSDVEYKTSTISILNCPSIEVFRTKHFSKRKPAILCKCMAQWSALTKWSQPTYIIGVAGERTVPIEIGSHYTNDDWAQDLVKLKDFIRRQFVDGPSSNQRIEYLAQHNLFDQIPQLRQDIIVPEYCCVSDAADVDVQPDIKAWFGPKGTVSPMHHDPKHNLLCQVFGHKRIILAAPDDTPNLYAHENEMLANTSLIDAENIDFDKFPLAANAKFYSLTLYKGEMLYIPPKWWHFVRSLDKSFSVSFWWE